jgi:hypothetical protein
MGVEWLTAATIKPTIIRWGEVAHSTRGQAVKNVHVVIDVA